MNPANDPWVITQREKLKYLEQFKSLQPQSGFVTGAQAKGFFLQSQLPPLILGQIWALADTDSDGKMNINEFSIACKLINLKLRGMEVPKALPPTLLASLSAVGGTPTLTPTGAGSQSPLDPLKGMTIVKPIAAPSSSVVVPIAPISGATLPGAVPAIPGIVPGSLPGVLPQQVLPHIPSAMTVASATGGGVPLHMPGVQPAMIPSGISGGVMPGGIIPGMPGMMPVGMIRPGTAPVLPPAVSNVSVIMPGAPIPGVIPTAAKLVSPPGGDFTKVPATPTPPQSNPPSRHMSISERAPSIESPQGDWAIKGPTKRKYTQVFNATDRTRSGYLTGGQARGILVQSKLPQATLAQIWTLSDLDSDGRLSCDEFILAMFLCDKAIHGEKIPVTLPLDWIPPSFRKTKSRQGSVSGPTGSTASSRHASVSSQGAVDADPAAGLPQTSFEDKRKENFDKGQAELDRRRKLLQDQQQKEKQERERKEREEADKREKARLEVERKQQEELERQLQKQRELEMEKEEQRKRELDAKEAARKELEKQRQLELEHARISEMNAQKQREQERVLKQKAHNTQLNVELSTLNEKIKDLSQKICDTRAGVTNVKTIIDGMRSQRDTSMTEMAQFKARIKEQNGKLLQLTQERAKWDAKTKGAGGVSVDAAQQEQLTAAFANKQLIIKQLKDKVENISKEIDTKKEDINSNDVQVAEVKGELAALIKKCEELYADYDTQRTQVLELKYNKKNDNVTATSAWDTGTSASASAWGTSVDNYGLSNDTSAGAATTAATVAVDTSGPAPEGFVKYLAVYEFSARNADEITFVPGDIIFVPLEQNAEPGWLAGEINGHTGWFPETYVEKVEDDYTSATTAATMAISADSVVAENTVYDEQEAYNDNSNMTAVPEATTITADAYNNADVEYYIAAYPYESTEAGDLSFGAGEMVMVTKKEGEWWTGTIGNRTGMFPSNYVQKADVGSATTTATATSIDGISAYDVQQDNIFNGNTNAQATIHEPIDSEETITTSIPASTTAAIVAVTSSIPPNAEEHRTNEDLDTEVSQINTQSKSQTEQTEQSEQSESYSRPMSRTSSMTPGMRAKRSEIAQVIAPYEATSPEQLSLTRGQLIMIRKKTDSGWWEGELQAKGRRRQIGWFPATYVKVLQGGRNSGRNTPVSGSRIEMTEQILDKVIALYPYKAQNDDELSFEKDDIISVLGRDEPEWWRGELNGLSGLFPSNYVGPFVTSGNI